MFAAIATIHTQQSKQFAFDMECIKCDSPGLFRLTASPVPNPEL